MIAAVFAGAAKEDDRPMICPRERGQAFASRLQLHFLYMRILLPALLIASVISFPFPFSSSPLTRSVRRRLERRPHFDGMVNDMATTLNELWGCQAPGRGQAPAGSSTPSAGHEQVFRVLREAASRFGPCPADLGGPGALEELRIFQSYEGDATMVAPVSFGTVDSISLPAAGARPTPMVDIDEVAGQNIARRLQELFLPRQLGLERLQEAGPRRLYTDLALRNPRLYAEVVRWLQDAGLVDFHSAAECNVGLFFVRKKSGQLRMILDGRHASPRFHAADSVELATGAAFSQIAVDGDEPICIGGVDIADALYQIEIPPWLRRFRSGMPRVRAGDVGIATLADGAPVKASSWVVVPCFRCPPMGWSIGLRVCQSLNEAVTARALPGQASRRLVDRRPAPALAEGPRRAVYVDNFIALPHRPREVRAAASTVEAELGASSLPTHPAGASVGGDALGWHFDAGRPVIGLAVRLRWRLRLAIGELLANGRCSGYAVMKGISHFTSRALIRRELLSCLSSVYAFVGEGTRERRRLPPAVSRELRRCRALLPLYYRDARRPLTPIVSCRWRFSRDGEQQIAPRDQALAQESKQARSITSTFSKQSSSHPAAVASALEQQIPFRFERAQGQEEVEEAPFEEVPQEVWADGWHRALSSPWSRRVSQVALEGRALILCLKRRLRALRNFGTTRVILNDSMAPLLALPKGRLATFPRLFGLAPCRVWRAMAAPLSTASLGFVASSPPPRPARKRPAAASPRPATAARRTSGPGSAAATAESDRRAVRRRERAERFGSPPSSAPRQGLTFLEEQSVSEATRIDYERRRRAFSQWAAQRGISIETPPEVDDALARFFREEFLDGGESCDAWKLMAALAFTRPDLATRQGRLPRAARAAKGWARLAPARSRLPLPWPVVCLVIETMCGRGLVAFAWITAVAFALYLRPREAVDLVQSQLIPPGFTAATSVHSRCVVLHMFERLTPSKTGVFDEGLLIDSACSPWMPGLVAELHRRTTAGHRLFPVSYAQWNYRFKAVVNSLGLNALGNLSLHQLRRGGASHELYAAARPLKDTQKRGRWATDAALRRYAKGGRVQEQLHRLPPGLQTQAERAFTRIGATPRAGRGVFLEVSSGAGGVSAARRPAFKAQRAAFELDFKNSSSHDLLLCAGWFEGG
ncbi:unnamed protein product [Prorocentrum cordatum]|uniref:Uncharacterized protein n=1 Tax=Prorocentrum cordatum TaxID=2364126 RepID=A0ABN9TBK9_9DINO|nr:unnamed protein product [Polarella glacialis]